jgi:hypothetical protein
VENKAAAIDEEKVGWKEKAMGKQQKFAAANQGKRQKVEYSSIKRKPKSLVNNICMFLFRRYLHCKSENENIFNNETNFKKID